jgi:hypothetical protein
MNTGVVVCEHRLVSRGEETQQSAFIVTVLNHQLVRMSLVGSIDRRTWWNVDDVHMSIDHKASQPECERLGSRHGPFGKEFIQ